MRKALVLVLLAALAVGVAGCGRGMKAVQVKGSDTMVNLGQAWVEAFMQIHPEIPVAITGGGSGTGVAALINGTTDIAMSSREMEEKEYAEARKKKVEPFEILVSYDGIVIAVSPKNPINKLTIQQLSDIFSGKTTNWKELGGNKAEIVALSRDRNSGTHLYFLEKIVKLGKKDNQNEFAKSVLMMPSNQSIVEEVSGNSAAIGYIGMGYLNSKLKAVAVAKANSTKFISPSIQTVANKTYPISRSLYLYTNGAPSGEVKVLVDFVLSDAGQKIVREMDFVPLK